MHPLQPLQRKIFWPFGALVLLFLAANSGLAPCGSRGGGGSEAGTTWTARTSGTSSSFFGVAYGAGTYVVVGQHGTILTSPNGVRWTVRTSRTSNFLSSVTYGNNTFVAVGEYGAILTSP